MRAQIAMRFMAGTLTAMRMRGRHRRHQFIHYSIQRKACLHLQGAAQAPTKLHRVCRVEQHLQWAYLSWLHVRMSWPQIKICGWAHRQKNLWNRLRLTFSAVG